MPKKNNSIPVNLMANEHGEGIAVERLAFADMQIFGEGERAHRHDGHSFFLLERGTITVEIDFNKYSLAAPSVIYVHPDQVHRTTDAENIAVGSLAITNENLHPEYRAILESIAPAKPLTLQPEIFETIFEAISLCIKLAERKTDKLYHAQLKDGCNALVALVISQYLAQARSSDKLSRFDTVTKAFRNLLERDFATKKRPASYAKKLNISIPYLNECVKNATGYSVSHHLQQRVILEAKRLLVHSDQSVKEIAAALGYDDYPYFSRLFTKITGMSALAFRAKNLG